MSDREKLISAARKAFCREQAAAMGEPLPDDCNGACAECEDFAGPVEAVVTLVLESAAKVAESHPLRGVDPFEAPEARCAIAAAIRAMAGSHPPPDAVPGSSAAIRGKMEE